MWKVSKKFWFFTLGVRLLFLSGCDFARQVEHENPIYLGKGQNSLMNDIYSMEKPTGILPYTLPVNDIDSYTFKSSEAYHEFFVYDRFETIVLLSVEPLYYLVIHSDQFYSHMKREHEKIVSGVSPSQKRPSSNPYLKAVGNYRVEVYFTPSEMMYATGGKLGDKNSTTHIDPYKLYAAAKRVCFYTPTFYEEKLYSDLLTKKQYLHGMKLVQYTRSASFSDAFNSSYITWYEKPALLMNFSFMLGNDLVLPSIDPEEVSNWDTLSIEEKINLDPNLGETGILGYAETYYEDQLELTEAFSLFISTPLGNSQDSHSAYLDPDSDNSRHGVAVMVRGPQDEFISFLSDEGIDFAPTDSLPVSLILEDRYDDRLYLTWTEEKNVSIEISYDNSSFTQAQVENQTTTTAHLTGISRGSDIYVRLIDAESGSQLAQNSTYYTDLVISEISYWGSSYKNSEGASDDDWIEITNISSNDVNLNEYDLINYNTNATEKFWFGPSNNGTASHAAIDYTIPPGGRVVVAIRTADGDRADEEFFFDDSAFGTPEYVIKAGTVSDNKLGENYRIKMFQGESVCQNILISGDYGAKVPFKTMVRDSKGSWMTSTHDSGYAPDTAESFKNYATPGGRGDGEL